MPLPTQPLTGIKLFMLIKLNIYLLYWYCQQNQCFNNKKHTLYNIHRLTCALARGSQATGALRLRAKTFTFARRIVLRLRAAFTGKCVLFIILQI